MPDTLRHVAISLTDSPDRKRIISLIKEQFKRDIPILTINLSNCESACIAELFSYLNSDALLYKAQAKVIVLGDWYELDPALVEQSKLLMDKTAEYDTYFITFCVGYSGREEILKASRLLAKRAQESRIAPDDIDQDVFKENLPSSYFVPPELIIETNPTFSGLLLWDSTGAVIYHDPGWKDSLKKAIDFRKKVIAPQSKKKKPVLKPLDALRKKKKQDNNQKPL